jgi:Reverse transcriptase (RNA-dependent DNA polymerase)
VSDNSEGLTSFVCPFGCYKYHVMPFGLKNAPGIFQKMMGNAIRSFSGSNVYAYLDDIVIGSETRAEHLKTVKKLLSHLVKLGLHGSKEKSQFFKSEMEFLGHVLSN